ncbi:aspartate aminotransferase family protein [Thalassobaculum sp.]|uniref:aspartate aminotransferase family protein n=1 Tax=Thalassobaculum sp. TaxID=2022740 RepID=UPI0032EF65C6
MTHVFHRQTKAVPPTAKRGDGVYVVDAAGKRYLDASGGAAVSCLGHSDVRVINAVKAQLDAIPYAHTGFFTNQPMEQLADFLAEAAPGNLDMVYFVSGGSEGVEAALKMARQYYLEIGQPQRHRIIARRQSYHGNTLGALAIGGNEWRREQFHPMLIDATHVAPCYEYRDRRDDETVEEYGIRVADELDAAIRAAGPETVAAFVCEPVVGATAGAVPAVPGYLKRVREICDRHGVLLIFDEVMCGMGRTGHLFACQEDGVTPDLLVIAKGLGAGYQPIGAVLLDGRIYAAIRDGSGFFQHGHTYMGHPAACAAGLAVQKVIQEDNLLENVRTQGAALRHALETRFGNNPYVGDIRGRGLFLGLELVADRGSKEPLDPARKVNAAIKREAMARGLMVYPMGGTIDGRRGDHVLVAPPFIINQGHITEIVEKLGDSIDAVLPA